MNNTTTSDPAYTYTLEDFIQLSNQDDITYSNFSIFQYNDGLKLLDRNIIDFYLDELKMICDKVTKITQEDIIRYKYSPDLLAYDIYGSTQLDFIVLWCNGIIDPKEFDFRKNYLYLPKASVLNEFLSEVYNSERNWLNLNKEELKSEESL